MIRCDTNMRCNPNSGLVALLADCIVQCFVSQIAQSDRLCWRLCPTCATYCSTKRPGFACRKAGNTNASLVAVIEFCSIWTCSLSPPFLPLVVSRCWFQSIKHTFVRALALATTVSHCSNCLFSNACPGIQNGAEIAVDAGPTCPTNSPTPLPTPFPTPLTIKFATLPPTTSGIAVADTTVAQVGCSNLALFCWHRIEPGMFVVWIVRSMCVAK